VIGIEQVVWNPERNRLFAKSAETLNQHSRHALIVTNGILDLNGMPVEASQAFRKLRRGAASTAEVREAITAAREVGTPPGSVVAATVFTTQSVTAVLEKIRDQIKGATPAAPRFECGPCSN
jgi:hypothetical protein